MRDIRHGIPSIGFLEGELTFAPETVKELDALGIPVDQCETPTHLLAMLYFNGFVSTTYPGGLILSHPKTGSSFNFHF